jgi:hypothetical protein
MRAVICDTIAALAIVTLPIWLDYVVAFGKAIWF